MNQRKSLVIIVTVAAWCCLSFASSSKAAVDADALAKQIEPLLSANTAVVAHIDATRLEIAPLFETMRQWTGAPKEQTAKDEQMMTATLAGLRDADVKDIFLLLEPTDVPHQGPLVALPVAASSDEKISALFQPLRLKTLRHGDVLLVGTEAQLHRPLGADGHPEKLAKALAATGDSVVQIAVLPTDDHRRVVEELLPKLPEEIGGGDTTNLTRGIDWIAVGINPPPKLKLMATVGAPSPEDAAKVNEIIKASLSALAKVPELKKAIPQIGEMLKAATPKISGNQLTLVLNGDRREGPTLESFLQPAILQSRKSAMRAQSVNNMKQLAIAMHVYQDTHKTFPPAYVAKDGKPLLSWRVLVLPYIEQEELYKEFKLEEPWDSAHNRHLIKRMPKIFRSPLSKAEGEGRTVYLVPRGETTVFPGAEGIKIQDIRDGTSNTIMIVEANDEQAVEWTKPDDWSFAMENPTAGLGQVDDVFNAAFADGSVRAIKLNVDKKTLRALFTRNGAEIIDAF